MVNVDQSTVNMDRVSNGLQRASGWAGLGQAWPAMWRAMVLPRHSRGPLLGHGPWLAGMGVAHGGPRGAGPWTADRSTVVRVHPSSLRRGPCAPCSCVCGQRGESSLLSCRRVPVGDMLTGKLPQQLRRPIEVAKSLPGPWRLQRWGQDDGWCFLGHWPRRTAARAQPARGGGSGAAA